MAPRYAISESESDPDAEEAPAAPSGKTLEKALRDAVAAVYKSKKMEELTIKRIRLAAATKLGLDEGFFKGSEWKGRSEQVIKDEVEVQDKATQESERDEDENEENSTAEPPQKAKSTGRTKSAGGTASRKRRKDTTPESEDEAGGSPSEQDVKKPTKKQARTTQDKPSRQVSKDRVSGSSDESNDHEDDDEGEKPSEEPTADTKADSESEMSVVLDEEPKPSRPRKKSTDGPSRKGAAKKPAPKAKGKDADTDPDQAEIKRLQGWLLKCGIRKMWARELAPYETPKAKIKHLKGMLKDAGMEGRYSLEKARQIQETRELQADLEMVQEGAKRWGKGSGDEKSDEEQPRRRLNRGRKTLAFLDSDGEESD